MARAEPRCVSGALEAVADFAQQHDVFGRCSRSGRCGFFRAAQAIDLLDHHEDDEGEDHEVDHDGDEVAVRQHRHAGLLKLRQVVGDSRGHRAQDHIEVREVQLAEHQPDDRHDDVGHERVDDLAEGRADDHADRQVDDIALDGKLLEFTEDGHGWEGAGALGLEEAQVCMGNLQAIAIVEVPWVSQVRIWRA